METVWDLENKNKMNKNNEGLKPAFSIKVTIKKQPNKLHPLAYLFSHRVLVGIKHFLEEVFGIGVCARKEKNDNRGKKFVNPSGGGGYPADPRSCRLPNFVNLFGGYQHPIRFLFENGISSVFFF